MDSNKLNPIIDNAYDFILDLQKCIKENKKITPEQQMALQCNLAIVTAAKQMSIEEAKFRQAKEMAEKHFLLEKELAELSKMTKN